MLLTGGSGLVGRNIQEHPNAKHWVLIAPTRDELDLTNAFKVSEWVKNNKPDIIVHAAGLVGGIKTNIRHPVRFLEENVTIGRNVIMAAADCQVKKLINLGSSCMYPASIKGRFKENDLMKGLLEPTNEGYALAKLFSTKLCEYIQKENPSMQYKTLIPCNIYGRYDKFDPNVSHLIAAIIQKIHTAKSNDSDTVDIWGDGKARREFLYAGDLADAILLAAMNICSVPNLMNIGFGIDYSINHYYETVAEVIGWNGHFKHDLSMPVGMQRKLTSTSLQKKWGWSAPTSLVNGVRQTYKYFLESQN